MPCSFFISHQSSQAKEKPPEHAPTVFAMREVKDCCQAGSCRDRPGQGKDALQYIPNRIFILQIYDTEAYSP